MLYQYVHGDKPLDGYTIKRGLGTGGFGEVYFAQSDSGKEVALKYIQKNLEVELRGVRQCLNLRHPNLVAQDPPKTSVAAARVPQQRDAYSIDQRIVEEDYVQIPLESSKHASIQECQAELDLILPVEAKRLIDTFVLQEVSADKLEPLTQEYILTELFDKTEHRVDSQDTPAGKLYQLQVRMVVEQPQLQQIRSWEQRVITASRVQRLGLISMVVLGCLSIISTTLGFLSKRLETVS